MLMNRRHFMLSSAAAALPLSAAEPPASSPCYELRTYYCHDGKLDALHSRFRDTTVRLFAKHGLTNVGYWTPLENPDRKLIYIIRAPDRAARIASFKNFGQDPEWKTAVAASEKDGKIVSKIESTYLQLTDFSPPVTIEKKSPLRTFELRHYTTSDGRLGALHTRFRDHTMQLFSKHGMTHEAYWNPAPDQPAAANTLIYLLSHTSPAARAASFESFRKDSTWLAAREASEKAHGGSLTIPDGVKETLMMPTDYSPMM